MSHRVVILDKERKPITQIKAFRKLNTSGQFLQYGKKLSDYAPAKFRVGTNDELFKQHGDILVPFFNHIRIYRDDALVWQGVIVKCPVRNKDYIEVVAYTYEYMLTTVLVKHDVSTQAGDGKDNYRTFSSGTMADAIQKIITETKDFVDANNILKTMNIGALENPVFPGNYVRSNGTALTGPWIFDGDITLSYDYRDILFVIQSLANYPACDFEVTYSETTNQLTFNFKQFIGNKRPDLVFEYSNYGSIEDYNIPLDGESMSNDITGVAADYGSQILHTTKSDPASIEKYGRIQGVAAYIDVKSINALSSRLNEELRNVSTPDQEVQITLNDRAYPLGVYDVGDAVTLRIKHGVHNINSVRRIVGYDVKVHTTGKESIRLVTNPLKEGL